MNAPKTLNGRHTEVMITNMRGTELAMVMVRRPSLWPLCVSTEAYLSDIRVCMVVFSGEARNGHKHVHTNIYPHLTHAQGFFLLLFLLLDNMFGILARAAHSHTERGT